MFKKTQRVPSDDVDSIQFQNKETKDLKNELDEMKKKYKLVEKELDNEKIKNLQLKGENEKLKVDLEISKEEIKSLKVLNSNEPQQTKGGIFSKKKKGDIVEIEEGMSKSPSSGGGISIPNLFKKKSTEPSLDDFLEKEEMNDSEYMSPRNANIFEDDFGGTQTKQSTGFNLFKKKKKVDEEQVNVW
eukprot:gene3441-6090_t